MTTGKDMDVYMQKLLQREFSGERVKIEVGPYTAMLLIAATQWVARQSQYTTHGPTMFDEVTKQLRMMFDSDPTGAALVEMYSPPQPERG